MRWTENAAGILHGACKVQIHPVAHFCSQPTYVLSNYTPVLRACTAVSHTHPPGQTHTEMKVSALPCLDGPQNSERRPNSQMVLSTAMYSLWFPPVGQQRASIQPAYTVTATCTRYNPLLSPPVRKVSGNVRVSLLTRPPRFPNNELALVRGEPSCLSALLRHVANEC